MRSDFAGFQCHAIQNRSEKKSKLVSRLYIFWLLYCRTTSGFLSKLLRSCRLLSPARFSIWSARKKKSVLFSSRALISNCHVLQIPFYKFMFYKSTFYKSMFYKSTFYKSMFYKSMFYKSTFYKSVFYKSTPVQSSPLHSMFYNMPIHRHKFQRKSNCRWEKFSQIWS